MKNDQLPTITQALIFRGKASLLQLKRGFQNRFNKDLHKFSQTKTFPVLPILGESKTPLWTEKEPGEQFLQAGKIQNLRIAIQALNGLQIPANEVFSFWQYVGKTTRRKGFVNGRELREGCIIPNVGGGLCQLSNALYDAALKADFEIIERHAHTQVVAGSLAEQGRDATVFWNYVDLRFKSPTAFFIYAELDAENLTVRFLGEKQDIKKLINISRIKEQNLKPAEIGSCATCGVNDCFRVVKPDKNVHDFGRTAYLVDEYSPEFDKYLQKNKRDKDILIIPFDGKRFKKSNYAWTTAGFKQTNQSFLVTAIRSYKSRQLASQGASRQLNLLAMYEKLADDYAKKLKYDCLHLVIQQNLLPFLWGKGHLGGRTFDVLMTSLPMRDLQKRLDFAKSLHPQSKTLGDFRANEQLLETEMKALRHANKIITPHTEIASLFPEKAVLLDWEMAKIEVRRSKVKNQKPTIVFPASTVGRKGAYELREALQGVDVKLITLGANLEDENFWNDFDVEKGNTQDWLEKADLVVLPAFVEHKPRRILQAISNGIPVIASKACGVENVKGVETVDVGDTKDLRFKI